MSITTKIGDNGKTTMGSNLISKSEDLIMAIARLDDLQSNICIFYNKMRNYKWPVSSYLYSNSKKVNEIYDITDQLRATAAELHSIMGYFHTNKFCIDVSIELLDEAIKELYIPVNDFIMPPSNIYGEMAAICRTKTRIAECWLNKYFNEEKSYKGYNLNDMCLDEMWGNNQDHDSDCIKLVHENDFKDANYQELKEKVDKSTKKIKKILVYINRLSDYFFALQTYFYVN